MQGLKMLAVTVILGVLFIYMGNPSYVSSEYGFSPRILTMHSEAGKSQTGLMLSLWEMFRDMQSKDKHIDLIIGGETITVQTAATSVGELLREQEVSIGKYDLVRPGLTFNLEGVGQVEVIVVEKEIVEEEQRIFFQEQRIPSNELARGVVQTIQPGYEGLRLATVEVTRENGVETMRHTLNTTVLEDKQDKIVEYGMLSTITRGGRTYEVLNTFVAQATAYTAGPQCTGKTPDDPMYGVTFSGLRVQEGHIAVDPRVIPLLSQVYIEGLDFMGRLYSGIYLATDTGSAIKGHKVDIFIPELSEALRFGRRNVKVYVLK